MAVTHSVLHWLRDCGHFPMWDQPAETVRIILETTGSPISP